MQPTVATMDRLFTAHGADTDILVELIDCGVACMLNTKRIYQMHESWVVDIVGFHDVIIFILDFYIFDVSYSLRYSLCSHKCIPRLTLPMTLSMLSQDEPDMHIFRNMPDAMNNVVKLLIDEKSVWLIDLLIHWLIYWQFVITVGVRRAHDEHGHVWGWSFHISFER